MNITIGGITKEVTDEQMEQIKELLDSDTTITISGKDLFELKTQIKKLLETDLRTPDNILFYAGEKVYGLFFNNNKQVLDYHSSREQWQVLATATSVPRNNRKLVPTLREDLKPGDIVYRSDKEHKSFTPTEFYGIVLNSDEVIYVDEGKETLIDDFDYNFWWKVV